jgi:hypothetical protein
MSAVKAAVPASSVTVQNKKALQFVLDTGPNEKNLEELGMSRDFQRDTKNRMIEINVQTGLPAKQGQDVPVHVVYLNGPVIAYGLISTVEDGFRLATICTQASTTYMVMVGKKCFHFVYDKTARSCREALETLFTECLNRGPRGYENNNTMIPDFWDRLLTLLMPEGGILEFGLFTRDKDYVPSRLYFTVGAKDHTLSVGGLCYNLVFDKFPRESINKGLNKWNDQQKQAGKAVGARVSLGDLIVPKGNKDKAKRPEAIDPAKLGIKPWEELVKTHERTPAEIEGDRKRALAVQAKREAKGGTKPAAKPEGKGKAKK